MEEMFAEVVAMAKAGRMTKPGLPRNPPELALLARTYDQEAHAPLLSVGVQRALLAPLVAWAKHPRAGTAVAGARRRSRSSPADAAARRGAAARSIAARCRPSRR